MTAKGKRVAAPDRRRTGGPVRRGRPPATDSADTRRAILAAARGCFGRQGYDKTTNKDIAAAAGITQAAIYHYFPSKADVFVAAYQDMQGVTFDRLEAAAGRARDLPAAIKAVLDLAAEMHAADRTLAAFTAVAPIEMQRHPELRKALGDEANGVYRFYQRLVEGMAAGLEREVDPDSVVNLLVATSTGFAQFGATARAAGAHRRAIDAFGRLVDGTLFDPDVFDADDGRGPKRRPRRLAGSVPSPDGDARERILAAARDCFGRYGYDKTTNKDIAGVAGFTAGAIYRHFPSKQDLFIAVYRGMQAVVFGQFEAAIAGKTTAPQKIKAILDLSVDLHAADRTLATFTAIAPVEIQRHPEIRRELGDDPVAVYRFFRRVIRDSAGDLAPGVETDAVADLLVAVATGFSQFGAITRSARPHREAIDSFERLVDGTLFKPQALGAAGRRRPRRAPDAAAG